MHLLLRHEDKYKDKIFKKDVSLCQYTNIHVLFLTHFIIVYIFTK